MRQYFVNHKQISNSPFCQNNSRAATRAVTVIYGALHQADSSVERTPCEKNSLYLFYLV